MKRFFDFAENLQHAHRIQYALVVILSIVVCVLCALNVYLSLTHSHFIVPYQWDRPIKIARWQIDPYYLGQLGLSDTVLYFNVHPQNIHRQSQWFLSRVWVKNRAGLQAKLDQREHAVQLHGSTQVFYPERYTIQMQSNTVHLYGELMRWLGSSLLDRRRIQVCIHYKNVGGSLYVQSWEEKAAQPA